MATEQTNITEAIAKAMAEAARAAVQAISVTGVENNTRYEGTQNVGPKMGRLMMKQPTFNWEAVHQWAEKLQIRGKLCIHIIQHATKGKDSIQKKFAQQKGLPFLET